MDFLLGLLNNIISISIFFFVSVVCSFSLLLLPTVVWLFMWYCWNSSFPLCDMCAIVCACVCESKRTHSAHETPNLDDFRYWLLPPLLVCSMALPLATRLFELSRWWSSGIGLTEARLSEMPRIREHPPSSKLWSDEIRCGRRDDPLCSTGDQRSDRCATLDRHRRSQNLQRNKRMLKNWLIILFWKISWQGSMRLHLVIRF